jgi:hypothetical protein
MLIDFLETGETIDDFLAVCPAILRQRKRRLHNSELTGEREHLCFRSAFIGSLCASRHRYEYPTAPEIEAGLRAEPAARGVDADTLIATAVKAYLREAPAAVPSSRQASSRDRSAEMAWAASPDTRFIGKWVVLEGGPVVASGSNPQRLCEDVRAKGVSSPFLIFVSSNGHEPFAGGWID